MRLHSVLCLCQRYKTMVDIGMHALSPIYSEKGVIQDFEVEGGK